MSLLLLFNQPSGSPTLSRTVGTRVSSNGTAVTSGSMVIPDNSLVVLITKTMRDVSDVSPLTITNSGTAATWTQQVVTPSQADQYSQRIWFHTAYFTTGGTFTFTATAASAPPGGFAALTLLPIVYQNASTTLGVSGSANNGPTDGAWTPSLSGAPAASSDVLAAITATVAGSGNIYQTDGSGVTRLDTANLAGVYGGSVSVRTGSTAASYTWDDVLAPSSTDTIYLNSIYAALEVKLASAGPTTHATTGALTGQIGSIAGTAARVAGTVTHATSGALTGQLGAIAGVAAHIAVHGTSGALTGQLGAVSGTANRFRVMSSSGVLLGQLGSVVGAASRSAGPVTHSTSGVLTGQLGSVAGSAARSNGATTHDTTGALTGQNAVITAAAARLRAFSTSGALTGQLGSLVGTAQRNTVHPSSGALAGQGATISGTASRAGTPVVHNTTGALVGAAAQMAGVVQNGQADYGRSSNRLKRIISATVSVRPVRAVTRTGVLRVAANTPEIEQNVNATRGVVRAAPAYTVSRSVLWAAHCGVKMQHVVTSTTGNDVTAVGKAKTYTLSAVSKTEINAVPVSASAARVLVGVQASTLTERVNAKTTRRAHRGSNA